MTAGAPDSSTLSDPELARRMAAGDTEAFGVLFRRHQDRVFRFCAQMLGSTEAAEDITQDVFMQLARSSHRYQPEMGALTTYLYGVARNLVRQHRKRCGRRLEVDVHALEERDAPVEAADPAARLVHDEAIAMLRAAIARLPARYREAIVLCELHACTYEDAAAIVGCPVGTIKSRVSRGRALLAAKIRAMSPSAGVGDAALWLVEGRAKIADPHS